MLYGNDHDTEKVKGRSNEHQIIYKLEQDKTQRTSVRARSSENQCIHIVALSVLFTPVYCLMRIDHNDNNTNQYCHFSLVSLLILHHSLKQNECVLFVLVHIILSTVRVRVVSLIALPT